MDFDLTEDQQLFRDTARRFLQSECPVDKVRALAEQPAGFDRDWWRRAAELGWMTLLVDEAHGGVGLGAQGPVYLGIVAEEMGRLVSPGPVLASSIVAAALSRASNADIHSDTTARLASGEIIAAWCLAEGDRASQPSSVALKAERTATGYRLTGLKTPVEAGAEADVLLVTAMGDGGLIQLLVPGDAKGVSIECLEGLDLVRRHARITFDGVEVADAAMVGDASSAVADVEHQMQLALTLQSAESSGAAERVFEFTLEWMFDRYSFGRPLASYQALKHRFADMKSWIEGCHAISSAAIRAVGAGDPLAAQFARAAKSYVSDRTPEIVQDCVQMHGGIGVTWDHDIHLYLRRVASNRLLYGGPADTREQIAALLLAEAGEA